MRRPYFGLPPWNLISPDLDHKTSFQRWNLVIILILGFVVLGIYVATIGSELMNQGPPTTSHIPSRPPQPAHGL